MSDATAQDQEIPPLPAPEPDGDTQPFWDSLKEHRLKYQRCRSCSRVQYYPRMICRYCHVFDQLEWLESTGQGTIYTFSVVHQNTNPVWKARTPYVIAFVDLDEGFRVTTRIVNTNWESVACGQRVKAVFEPAANDMTLLHFQPVA